MARLAAWGLGNREIAQAIAIAERAVANHLQRVLDKRSLRSRTPLATRGAAFGLEAGERGG